MPIYEYVCPACGHAFEELVRSQREAQRVACPKCGGRKVERRPSVFAAHGAPERPARPPDCARCSGPGGTCPLAD